MGEQRHLDGAQLTAVDAIDSRKRNEGGKMSI